MGRLFTTIVHGEAPHTLEVVLSCTHAMKGLDINRSNMGLL